MCPPATSSPQTPSPSSRSALTWALLLILCVAALQLLPNLGLVDFHNEEGRRVLPARELLESGNWVVPTLWGVPYLSKPPGIYWAMALIFQWFGNTSEWAARSLSAGSTLLTALGLLWLGRRMYGLRAGKYAALLFLLAVETQSKGRLAEIEAPLTLALLVAVGSAWIARTGRPAYWTLAGLGLAAAVLLKGPAALLFFFCAPLLMALVDQRGRELLRPGLWWSVLLGLGLSSVWAWRLFDSIGVGPALAAWTSQVAGQGGRTVGQFLRERGTYLLGSFLAFAPALWIVLAALGTPLARRWQRQDQLAWPLWTALGGWLFFLFFPGTSVRYLAPAFPFVCLLAGEALVAPLDSPARAVFERRLGKLAKLFRGLALLLALALVVAFFRPLGGISSNAWGLFLALLLLGFLFLRPRTAGERPSVTALLFVPLVLGQVYATQVEPTRARNQARAIHAAAIDAALPEAATLHILPWTNFNALFYVEHELSFTPDPSSLRAGAWLFAEARQLAELQRARPQTRRVLTLQVHGHEVLLLQLGPASAP